MRGSSRILFAFAAALTALILSHLPLLSLPFYWDELGQFIPAALDIYHRLAWVPYTTVPNVHPPGLMAYLAAIWGLTGFSILHTRIAMLALAACALLAQWQLTRTLSGDLVPARLATIFLFCSPLFFAQAELAQLDLPAALFTTVALILFFEKRYRVCAFVCCVAVMVKETALVAPGLFGILLLRRRDIKAALWFVLPLAPLVFWLVTLHRATGHWFGSPEFTDYNLFYPLHPVRLSLALLRRGYYLFIGSGHILGLFALIVWLRRKTSRSGEPILSENWRIAFLFVLLHVLMISVLGGAVLERYLLPALPILYAGFGTAIWSLWPRIRGFAAIALAGCLLTACVVNPPYPFPMENNLAWTTFVTLHQQAAQFAEAALPNALIATSFPLAGALRRPEMGYVTRPLRVLEINDFRQSNLTGKVRNEADALIEYSVMWDPLGILRRPLTVHPLRKFYGYVPQVPLADVPGLTGMQSAFRLCSAGQCVEVFRKPGVSRR